MMVVFLLWKLGENWKILYKIFFHEMQITQFKYDKSIQPVWIIEYFIYSDVNELASCMNKVGKCRCIC